MSGPDMLVVVDNSVPDASIKIVGFDVEENSEQASVKKITAIANWMNKKLLWSFILKPPELEIPEL
jgi:hypothetical protein